MHCATVTLPSHKALETRGVTRVFPSDFCVLGDLFLLGSKINPAPPAWGFRLTGDFPGTPTEHSILPAFPAQQEPGPFHLALAKRSCWCLGWVWLSLLSPCSSKVSECHLHTERTFPMLLTETILPMKSTSLPLPGTTKAIATAPQDTYSKGGRMSHLCWGEGRISLGLNSPYVLEKIFLTAFRSPRPWLGGKRSL
jgi:hypothetical protein